MASIEQRIAKDGTVTWRVQVRKKDIKPISKTFDSQFDAEKFANCIETEHSKTVKIFKPEMVEVLEEKFRNEKTVDTIARFIRSDYVKQRHLNIMPTLVSNIGEVRNGQISKSWVKNFIKHMRAKKSQLGRPYADSTIGALIWTMNVALKWRSDDLDIPTPTSALTINGIPGTWDIKRDRRLAKSEEALLFNRLAVIQGDNREQWQLLIKLALETAARLSELVLMDWKEVDIERRLWIIEQSHTKMKKARAVPLTLDAVNIFTRLKALAKPGDPRVFHGLGSKPHCVTACFHRYVKQAGISDYRFHDLRHEAISRMALYWRNFTMFEIMLIVGHTRMEMFQRYANLRADELASKLDFKV